MRYDFASDNTAAMAPEALDGLMRANAGFAAAYGEDEVSARAADLIRARLDADAEIRFVFNGTAANAIALAMLARPFETVLAHVHAHVCVDEAGAPAFFGQGLGLKALGGAHGKIDESELEAALAEPEESYIQPPGALSVTQATEFGGVYSVDQLRRLIEPCRLRGMKVHMDGARLANAAASGFDLPEIARLGVDILTLGFAKAGAPEGEALVLFDRTLARRIDNRLKQAGQVASKSRFLAAPILALLETGAWEGHSAHANRMAARLAEAVRTRTPFEILHPVEANTIFVRMPRAAHERLLASGWMAYGYPDGTIRFACSWASTPDAVDEFADALAAVA
jgi:threonine aldolase